MGRPPAGPALGQGDYARERNEVKLSYILGKLAKGTRQSYGGAWRQWCLFLRARGRDPFLLGGDSAARRQDEEILLDFI
eukprot:7784696-Lingulodinium_polyedra.AAC.1